MSAVPCSRPNGAHSCLDRGQGTTNPTPVYILYIVVHVYGRPITAAAAAVVGPGVFFRRLVGILVEGPGPPAVAEPPILPSPFLPAARSLLRRRWNSSAPMPMPYT